MRGILNFLMTLVLIVLIIASVFLGWLTAVEYMPAPVEDAELVRTGANQPVKTGVDLSLLTWNIGYAGLGKNEDFFMDGGKMSKPRDRDVALGYLEGIQRTLARQAADIFLLQEVDADSSRSYNIDERSYLDEGMSSVCFAPNYSCPFVPYPWPPIGRVYSGLFTMTNGLTIDRAERVSLPCPFSWPVRVANLKRCLLVSYLPVDGSDRQLVLINLHLEAYDSGEGKIAQTKQLRDFMESEYKKGNYVIAGGDFNQAFPGSFELYPNRHVENWAPGELSEAELPAGFRLVYDSSTPTCRLLNQPYNPADRENTQHYVIDGMIFSPNVELKSVETVDAGFAYADHNPVRVVVELKES